MKKAIAFSRRGRDHGLCLAGCNEKPYRASFLEPRSRALFSCSFVQMGHRRRAMRVPHLTAITSLALGAAALGTASASAEVLAIVCIDPGDRSNDYYSIDLDAKTVRMNAGGTIYQYRDGAYGVIADTPDAVPRHQFVVVTDENVKFGVRERGRAWVLDFSTGLLTPPDGSVMECRKTEPLR
jgi:hypothetical protein